MVLVDTSVWIELYRKKNTSLGEFVSLLTARNEAAICGQIYVEFVGGFRNRQRRKEFGEPIRRFPFIDSSQEIFKLAAELLGEHPRLGSGDSIIAATAMVHRIGLLTLDKDFQALKPLGLILVNS